MDEEKPKSIWAKSVKLPGLFGGWLILLVATTLIFSVILMALGEPFHNWSDLLKTFAASLVIATVLFCFWLFIRWIFRWRNFKRFLFVLACFVTLLALFYVEEDWRGKYDWEKFKREWKAKGMDFEWASVIPPKVPDDQNFALTPIVASCYETYFDKNGHEIHPRNTNIVDRFSLLSWRDISYEHKREPVPPEAGWPAAQRINLKAWQSFFRTPPPDVAQTNSFPVTLQPQLPAEDVLLALSKYDSAIKEIREASQMPYSRFPLTYEAEDKAAILLPHLAALKTTSLAIRLRSVAELEKNEPDRATEDVKLDLYLANATQSEPFLISQLVRYAMLGIALQPVWEGLAAHRWSGPQLIALDAELARINLLNDCREAQKSEVAAAAETAEYMSRHRDFARQFAQMGMRVPRKNPLRFGVFKYMPAGWFYQSALKDGRKLINYMPAVDQNAQTISPRLVRQADSATESSSSYFDPLEALRESFSSDFLFMGNFLKQTAYAQASVNLARTAIALERYRLVHGNYPESLAALAPQFIAQLPQDVTNGEPLKYRREADGGFVLYSIGWNEQDDGGVVVFKKGSTSEVDLGAGDWVWRYPPK